MNCLWVITGLHSLDYLPGFFIISYKWFQEKFSSYVFKDFKNEINPLNDVLLITVSSLLLTDWNDLMMSLIGPAQGWNLAQHLGCQLKHLQPRSEGLGSVPGFTSRLSFLQTQRWLKELIWIHVGDLSWVPRVQVQSGPALTIMGIWEVNRQTDGNALSVRLFLFLWS